MKPSANIEAIDLIDKQIDDFNASRIPNMGISPIERRVHRIERNKKQDEIVCYDQNDEIFFIMNRETDSRFKGIVETPYHQAAFSGPNNSHSWGHVLVEFYLDE
jgi:hypothetical protein